MDRRVAGALLEKQADIAVDYANNGGEALDFIERQMPDVVVTDLQMPELDGLQLVESIRVRFAQLPTVLMTAHGSEEIALQALRQGAVSYVPKRHLARDLADTVRGVLNLARSRTSEQQLFHSCWKKTEFHFVLDNDEARIPLLVTHLQQYMVLLEHCDKNESVRVGVALHEALRNAMHHGNLELDSALRQHNYQRYYELAAQRRNERPYATRRVHVTAYESRDEACYTIRDEGPGFDPIGSYKDPTVPENLDKPSGRGLFLIRTFMHEVRFNDIGNEIKMIHRRASAGAGRPGTGERTSC
jgi:DNA-binding response OmpR family regulator